MNKQWTKVERKKRYLFIKFSLNKQKLDLERTMGVLGKPFSKKNQKNFKKRKLLSECRKWSINHSRESEIWFKRKNRPRMNYDWIGKTIFVKNPIQEIEKK